MATVVPAEVFPPGEFIKDELEARGWTQADLAEVMERPVQAVSEIIRGKKRVTEETARELEAALGIEAEFWTRTEALYRLRHTEPASIAIAERASIRQRVPLRQMISRGWVKPSTDVTELKQNVLSFLGVDDLQERAPFAKAAKQREYDQPSSLVQEVWLLRVKQLAESMITPAYSREKLLATVERMKPLLREPELVGHVPKLLDAAGVRFLIVERLPGLKTDGVCFWIHENSQPVIGMSLTADRIDNFWFVLRHEVEHVLNEEGKSGAIVDDDLEGDNDSESPMEARANRAAAEFCLPQAALQSFIDRKGPLFTDQNIRLFARVQGRHPGIVAGQLRRRLKAWNKFTKHLAKVREHVTATAVVDGFGTVAGVGL